MKPELEIELKAVRLIQRRGLPVIPATIHIPEAQPGSFRPMTLEETRQAGADAARHLRRALLGKHPVICLLFVLFASFCSLRAATVTGLVQQITLNWSTNTTIIFSNLSTPSITGGGALVTSQPKPSYTTTAGWFSNYLTFGTYKVFVGPSPRDIVTVQIPDDTGTYDLWSLRTNSLSTSSNAPTIVRGVAQGTNGILTVTNSGVVTVHFTGSTGGGSTDLTDLNAATNALNSRAASLEGQTNALGARVTSVESQTNSLGTRVTALEAGSGGVTTSVATNIAQYFATNATAAASNSLWLAPYALSFPTGLVVYTHPRSGFFTDSSGTAAATNQALIARWNDVSGRGNHLTSTNTTARPRLIYEGGNPLAFFANGESQSASNVLEFPPGLMFNSRAFSIFFVLQPMATLTNLGILQASNTNPGIIIEANGTERGVVSLYGSSLVQSHIQTRASWSVLGVVGDTNNARIYHHGESTNLAAYASATASGGIIGRWVNQRPFYGKIASVLLFDRALPAQEAESVVAKLEESFKLSTPNRNRLIIIGDSIVRGDTTSNGLSYAQQVAKRLGPEWETINLGLGGQYLSTIKNYATNTIVPLLAPGRRNVVLIEAGSNDIKLGGASGEDTFTNLVTLAGTITRAGGQVVVADILPRQADATFNTKRLTFNSLVSSTWTTWASGYAPFASDGTIGDSGDEANATYYSDTIHPTEQGAGIMANWTAPVILSLPLSYQPASAALTNLAGNPNVATNILGAGTVTVSSNNAGGWTITGSGSSADTSGLPSITRLDFQRRDPSNGITALTDESGLAYRLIGNTDQAQITNGAFKLNFKAIPTNGAAAVYIVGTNQQRITALGMKYAVTNDTGSATTPFTVLIVQSNSLESAGTMQLGAGFHIPISNAGVDVQLYTNGVGSAISLGTIPFRNYFTDGYLRSLAVVFNGDNTITVQGDGIYGTVTNARVEAVRGAEGNTGHFTFEQYAVGTNITYQPLWASLWTANAAAWNQLKAAQDQSVNLDGQMFTRVSSNAFAHIGDQSVPVSAYQWWVSNTSKAMLLDSNGYLAIARSAKPDSAIRAPLSIYSPPGSSGGQVDLSSTADSQNVGLRFTRDQANKFFVGLLGNTSDLSIYSDNGGGLLSRWYDASGALYNVGALTNGGGIYAQTGVAIGTNNLGPSALDVHGGIRLHRPPASSLLMLNGSQDLTNVTIGSGLSLAGTTLSVSASASQTPWVSDIDGAGYSLTNAGNLTSTGTVTAAEFVGMDSSSSGSLTLQATNPTGAITFTLPATSTASNNFSFHFSSITAGDVFKVHSISGNNVVMTNAVDNNSGGGGGGSSNLATVTITNSLRFGETNIIVDSTANRLLDLSVWTMFKVSLLTNATLTFTNVPASGLQRAQVLIQQDTNGQRTVNWSVAGGLLQTNATLQPTTNANALDLLEVASSYFPTNLLAWWPQNFQARVAFTNSLATAGGGGGGGLLPTPTAYWNFDASASSDEADQTGNGVTLWQSNSAASVSGLIGNARSLQSNALQYFVLTNSALVFSNRSWSLLTWQKSYPTNVAGGLFSRYLSSGVSREWYLYRQGGGANNHRYAFVYSTNGAASFVQGNMSTTRPATNSWHLVAMTVDVTNRQIRTCVMWQSSTNWLTNSVAGAYNQNGTANLFIGRDGQGLYNDGAVDETSIYLDAALDESQVGWYFNNNNGRSYPW